MPIINSIVSWIMKQRIHQIELFIKYPIEVQEDWFRKLLATAKGTEWGLRFDYNSIRSVKEYQSRVPVQDYTAISPYVDRLMKGEQRLLWPTDVKWFAKSSGTTSAKSKFIPVTQEALEECHFKGGKDLLSIYCTNHPETQLFNGKLLTMGGSHQLSGFSNETFYGDLSAILIQNLPFWMELFRTPDISIALMDEWEAKILRMAETTMREDVTNISGVPSWTLVLMHKILELTGKSNITEVWPNLELFIHGAVSFEPYRSQFETLIPSPGMRYYETYNASEGFFGIQDVSNSREMLLMLDYGIFYEFIPMSQWNSEHPETLTLDQVKVGENYAVVISTNGGLWRYKIGDTISFTSVYPFRFRITGRTAHFINAFGEELIVENADKAIAAACDRSGCLVREYTACPVYISGNNAGAHEWLIEFEKEPDDMNAFAVFLDEELKNVNSDYEAKRHRDLALRPPVVRKMPEQTFYNWLKSKGKVGGQHKVPRLSNNRNVVEEILSTVAVRTL